VGKKWGPLSGVNVGEGASLDLSGNKGWDSLIIGAEAGVRPLGSNPSPVTFGFCVLGNVFNLSLFTK
jgi:hypothetical protein